MSIDLHRDNTISITDATAERELLARTPKRLFIGGRWCQPSSGRSMAVIHPATGKRIAEVADGDASDARGAIAAADQAFGDWRRTSPRERANILRHAYELTIERREELALLITLEMGKPLAESLAEVTYAADFLRWYSEEAVRIGGRYTVAENGSGRLLTTRQPVGPCVRVTAWNFPLAMGARKIAPALAAGCTVADEFAQRLAARMSSLTVARGTDPAAEVGPLINENQRARVQGCAMTRSAVAPQ